MKITNFSASRSQEVIDLFTKVFSASEGREAGEAIGWLVADLINTTREADILGFVALLEDEIVGCIFFTRLTLSNDKTAFMLSPVAIAIRQQGKGTGQALIRFGLESLKSMQVDLVVTYGDPAFYSKAGFQQISEEVIKAPQTLTQPEGWLAQSLQNGVINVTGESCQCVEAFNKQEYW